MISNLVRKNIVSLRPYSSARNKYLNGLLLDANENPYEIYQFNDQSQVNRYPDPNHNDLRLSLAQYYNTDKNNLFAGSGSDEIIDLLIRIFCEPGRDNIIVTEPTYGMYRVAADINNIKVKTVGLNEKFLPDYETITESIDEHTKLIFICSPNNPTGNLTNYNTITKIAKDNNLIVVIDEAYIEFAGNSGRIDEYADCKNIVRVRTFSKAWGLAGIRLGYCYADEDIIKYLYAVKPPYNLGKFVQNAGIKALSNPDMKDLYVAKILKEKERLYDFLSGWKYIDKVFHSDANFILFRTPVAEELFNYLVSKNIIIRDRGKDYKLNNCLRITVGTETENEILISAMAEFK